MLNLYLVLTRGAWFPLITWQLSFKKCLDFEYLRYIYGTLNFNSFDYLLCFALIEQKWNFKLPIWFYIVWAQEKIKSKSIVKKKIFNFRGRQSKIFKVNSCENLLKNEYIIWDRKSKDQKLFCVTWGLQAASIWMLTLIFKDLRAF